MAVSKQQIHFVFDVIFKHVIVAGVLNFQASSDTLSPTLLARFAFGVTVGLGALALKIRQMWHVHVLVDGMPNTLATQFQDACPRRRCAALSVVCRGTPVMCTLTCFSDSFFIGTTARMYGEKFCRLKS